MSDTHNTQGNGAPHQLQSAPNQEGKKLGFSDLMAEEEGFPGLFSVPFSPDLHQATTSLPQTPAHDDVLLDLQDIGIDLNEDFDIQHAELQMPFQQPGVPAELDTRVGGDLGGSPALSSAPTSASSPTSSGVQQLEQIVTACQHVLNDVGDAIDAQVPASTAQATSAVQIPTATQAQDFQPHQGMMQQQMFQQQLSQPQLSHQQQQQLMPPQRPALQQFPPPLPHPPQHRGPVRLTPGSRMGGGMVRLTPGKQIAKKGVMPKQVQQPSMSQDMSARPSMAASPGPSHSQALGQQPAMSGGPSMGRSTQGPSGRKQMVRMGAGTYTLNKKPGQQSSSQMVTSQGLSPSASAGMYPPPLPGHQPAQQSMQQQASYGQQASQGMPPTHYMQAPQSHMQGSEGGAQPQYPQQSQGYQQWGAMDPGYPSQSHSGMMGGDVMRHHEEEYSIDPRSGKRMKHGTAIMRRNTEVEVPAVSALFKDLESNEPRKQWVRPSGAPLSDVQKGGVRLAPGMTRLTASTTISKGNAAPANRAASGMYSTGPSRMQPSHSQTQSQQQQQQQRYMRDPQFLPPPHRSNMGPLGGRGPSMSQSVSMGMAEPGSMGRQATHHSSPMQQQPHQHSVRQTSAPTQGVPQAAGTPHSATPHALSMVTSPAESRSDLPDAQRGQPGPAHTAPQPGEAGVVRRTGLLVSSRIG